MKRVYYKVRYKLNKVRFLMNYYYDDLIIIFVFSVATAVAIYSDSN